jgi:hypothetical protein
MPVRERLQTNRGDRVNVPGGNGADVWVCLFAAKDEPGLDS